MVSTAGISLRQYSSLFQIAALNLLGGHFTYITTSTETCEHVTQEPSHLTALTRVEVQYQTQVSQDSEGR
jgi:hypothetical protein